jgi:hypothetical protein
MFFGVEKREREKGCVTFVLFTPLGLFFLGTFFLEELFNYT